MLKVDHIDVSYGHAKVLHDVTLAFGQRRNADGTTDLWAEVPRTSR
jgi:hypothetical protein